MAEEVVFSLREASRRLRISEKKLAQWSHQGALSAMFNVHTGAAGLGWQAMAEALLLGDLLEMGFNLVAARELLWKLRSHWESRPIEVKVRFSGGRGGLFLELDNYGCLAEEAIKGDQAQGAGPAEAGIGEQAQGEAGDPGDADPEGEGDSETKAAPVFEGDQGEGRPA